MDWVYVYGRIITNTGWTHAYVDTEVTLPVLDELFSYWRDHPTVHELFASFVDYKPRKKSVPKNKQAAIAEFHGFVAELGGAFKGERAKL